MNRDEIFLICKKLDFYSLIRFSSCIMVGKDVWRHKLLEFPDTKLFDNKNDRKLYILLYRLQVVKEKFKLIDNLYQIYHMKYMNLNSLNLREIPKEISCLTHLEDLSLKYNEITDIKRLCFLNLRKLYLSFNCIKEIPKEIYRLKNLGTLYLGYNAIREIPIEMCSLINLKVLALDDNLIEEVPAAIIKLMNLKYLYVNNNRIMSFPKELKKMKGLNFYY